MARLCAVHNKVNIRLEKPEFDCAYLGDTYDCGCGPEPGKEGAKKGVYCWRSPVTGFEC